MDSVRHWTLNYFNYYTEIEDTFIRRRGKHLLLSPMDWALIESWRTMGVPLHVALRGIERSFDSHGMKPRRRSVKSLMYCQEEVEAQYAEWLDAQRGASAATAQDVNGNELSSNGDAPAHSDGLPFPREAILANLSESGAALSAARAAREGAGLKDELSEALARAAARLDELAGDFARAERPNAEALEDSLSNLEELLDRAIRASLSPPDVAAKRAREEESLRSYRKRMERATYEATLDNLLAKRLREECGVPRLSLFHL